MTRSEEFTNARYEDVIRTDTQCIFPPPCPKLQCWFSSVSRLPPTLNSRGAGFVNVDVRYLALKQRVLFFRVYRSQVRVFEGILPTAHHLWLLTCSSLSSAYVCVMHVHCAVCVLFLKRVFHDVWSLYTQKRMKSMKSDESPCEIRCETNEILKSSLLLKCYHYSLKVFKDQEDFRISFVLQLISLRIS